MYSIAEAVTHIDNSALGARGNTGQAARQARQTQHRGPDATREAAQAQTSTTAAQQPGQKETRELVTKAQEALEEIQHRSLQFSVDESTGRTVIKVIDKESGDVIKEIPPEEALRLAEKIQEMSGLLFDRKA